MSIFTLEDRGNYKRILIHKNLYVQLKKIKKNPKFRGKTLPEITKYVKVVPIYPEKELKKSLKELAKALEL